MELLLAIPVACSDIVDMKDWVGWGLTLLAAAASTFVAIAAWRTSKKAANIAAAALVREQERDEAAYTTAITEAMARLFLAMAEYATEAKLWLAAAAEIAAESRGNPDELTYPDKPSTGAITALFEASRLIARGDDKSVLVGMERYILAVRESDISRHELWLRRLITGIRKWRDGTWTANGFKGFLRDKAALIEGGR